MKSFKFFLLPLLLLAACKKNNEYQSLAITGMSSMAFASGDAISIYGSGFDTIPDNNTVTFDGVAGEVATSTPNRLQVIVPVLTGSGHITVRTHGQFATSTQSYTLVNVLQGTYTNNLTLTPDKKYLLRGAVVFDKAKLIIQPGTVIYGEKLTHGSLTCSDIDWEGTAAQPIVFTSDQAPGSRAPGDWTGITTVQGAGQAVTNIPVPIGIMEYVRVEYAGYTANPSLHGQAMLLFTDAGSVMRYIQVSYSAGDGITTYEGGQNTLYNYYMEHLIAFGCAGDDFRFTTAAGTVQYALGLKDPYLANPLQGNGINICVTQANPAPTVVSNFTLIGYDPAARNLGSAGGAPLTQNAGAGVKVGDVIVLPPSSSGPAPGTPSTESFAMYNSVIAGSWQAGVSFFGNPNSYYYPTDWDSYEDSAYLSNYGDDVTFRYNFITGTAGRALPYRGGVLGREAYLTSNYNNAGFEDITGTIQQQLFGYFNDTTRGMDLTAGQDPLGIKGLADYAQLNHPGVLPAAGSPLLTGAQFPGNTPANTPQLNKDITYIGAFGAEDWTAGWSNFNPQQTQY
ncbi:MAG TPA: IPT/TIG domain-containing protein [Puia sp.]|nr:IPT/TIG domain-containing protein [Puia sp.]